MGNRPSQTIRCSDCTKPDLEIHETQSAGAGQKAVSSKCPVAHGGAAKIHSPVPENYNTRNMMPEISQTRGPDQKINLSTERTVSSIPKGRSNDSGEADNWVYPSPQQFFNALKRKGKEAPEDAVPVMVDIHNFINENCWNEIKKWESLFHCDCDDISLSKFQGKADVLSPQALFNHYVMGADMPFDRHDWTINRCGLNVRYIIDYYAGSTSQDGDTAEFSLVVRPAIDSFSSAWDRIRMGIRTTCGTLAGRIRSDSND